MPLCNPTEIYNAYEAYQKIQLANPQLAVNGSQYPVGSSKTQTSHKTTNSKSCETCPIEKESSLTLDANLAMLNLGIGSALYLNRNYLSTTEEQILKNIIVSGIEGTEKLQKLAVKTISKTAENYGLFGYNLFNYKIIEKANEIPKYQITNGITSLKIENIWRGLGSYTWGVDKSTALDKLGLIRLDPRLSEPSQFTTIEKQITNTGKHEMSHVASNVYGWDVTNEPTTDAFAYMYNDEYNTKRLQAKLQATYSIDEWNNAMNKVPEVPSWKITAAKICNVIDKAATGLAVGIPILTNTISYVTGKQDLATSVVASSAESIFNYDLLESGKIMTRLGSMPMNGIAPLMLTSFYTGLITGQIRNETPQETQQRTETYNQLDQYIKNGGYITPLDYIINPGLGRYQLDNTLSSGDQAWIMIDTGLVRRQEEQEKL